MSYIPEVNDYVIWNDYIKGWVYFKGNDYITIESSVKPKDVINYKASPIHANDRLLILCYSNDWKDLKYVRSRKSIYEN